MEAARHEADFDEAPGGRGQTEKKTNSPTLLFFLSLRKATAYQWVFWTSWHFSIFGIFGGAVVPSMSGFSSYCYSLFVRLSRLPEE